MDECAVIGIEPNWAIVTKTGDVSIVGYLLFFHGR